VARDLAETHVQPTFEVIVMDTDSGLSLVHPPT
jgi:hypothetical protein